MSTSQVNGAQDAPDRSWRRSSRCANAGCVEVAVHEGQVHIRDSKRSDDAVLSFDAEEWRVFVAAVKDSEFDV